MFFLDHKTVVTSNVHGLIYLQTLMSFCASPLGEGEARGSVAGIPPLMGKAGTPSPQFRHRWGARCDDSHSLGPCTFLLMGLLRKALFWGALGSSLAPPLFSQDFCPVIPRLLLN